MGEINAVNQYTADQLYAAFRKLDSDNSISAGVITSTSNNFCSGYDLKELANMGTQGNEYSLLMLL